MKGTRRMIGVLLALALTISVCACASAPDEPSTSIPWFPENSSTQQAQEPSSDVQEEPAALPETLPEDTTELTVPLQMVGPGTEDIFSPGEWSYSTQEDVDICRQWLYDLRAEDITALYGEISPLDHYWSGEMNMEDSRKVVDLLRSMAPYLTPLAEGNPATGGGWTVAVYTEDGAVDISCDGYWFTFTHQGTIWIIDGTDPAVVESSYEIQTILWYYGDQGRSPSEGPPVYPVAPTETYFSDDVQAIYAIDRENYVMAEVKDGYVSSKEIWEGLQNRASTKGEASGYGYLIITDEGKEYVYLTTDDGDLGLNKNCQAALNGGPLHPSWLIHMTPERIKEFKVMGAGNDDPITDRDQLLAVAKFLKKEATVQPEVTVSDGPTNPDMVGGLFWLRLTFDSGVQYDLMGYDYFDGTGSVSIYSSDLNKRVSYKLDDGVASKFTAYK